MTRRSWIVPALAALALAAGAAGATGSASAQSPAPQPVTLPNHVLGMLGQASHATMTPNAAGQPITITLTLNRTDQAGFDAFLTNVQTPGSKDFGRFLSQAQLSTRFGPSQQAYSATLDYMRQSGFTLVAGSANRLTQTYSGTRQQAEQAFGVTIGDYVYQGRSFYANSDDPTLPSTIAHNVQAISGLNNLAVPSAHPSIAPPSSEAAATPDAAPNPRTPMSFAAAYDAGGLGASINGAGQKIGLVEFAAYNTTDISSWISFAGLPASQINKLSTANISGGTTSTNGSEEVVLDIDAALGFAQGASVVAYIAPNPTPFQTVFNAMINDGDTVISNSWGGCECQITQADVQSIDSVIASAAASGIAVFNASDDNGPVCMQAQTGFPQDAPHGIAVGGTNLQVGTSNAYQGESYWSNGGAGGYGISEFFTRPASQDAFVINSNRSVPDVSAEADGATGMTVCMAVNGGCTMQMGGTSLAAPLWASGWALINQKLGHPTANPVQALYAVANSGAFHNAASMNSDFAHVGLGSLDIARLATVLGASGGSGGTSTSTPTPATPTVTAISPAQGGTAGHTTVTISGTGFSTTAAATTIRFGTGTATSVSCSSATSCTASSPTGTAGSVDVKVTVAGKTSGTVAVDKFAYVTTPVVSRLTPAYGAVAGGTSVTISGSGFSTTSGATTFSFGTNAATQVHCTSTSTCTATAPAGSGSVNVSATVASFSSAAVTADQFTYAAQPTISALSVSVGPATGGTTLTVTGTNFRTTAGGTTISFGPTAGSAVTCASSTSCTVRSPGGRGTADVTATVLGQTSAASSADQFTFVSAPVVTSVSPRTGTATGGTVATVTGTDLTSSLGASTISFGSAAATNVSCSSATTCTATAPAGANAVDVRVTAGGQASAIAGADKFTYLPVAGKAEITQPVPGSTLTDVTSRFTWSAGSGALEYYLYVGKTQGAHDIWGASTAKIASATVSNLPADGSTVYVRLWTRLAPPSGWVYSDYTYTARTAAAFAAATVTSPADQATLSGSSATLAWSAGSNVAEYWLSVGTTASGNELLSASEGTNLQATVANLPTDGSTIYAHLWSRQTGAPSAGWTRTDVSYTAATAATPTSPAAGTIGSPAGSSTLTGSSATFSVAAGMGASQYWLYVGSTQGGRDLYAGTVSSASLAATVSGLPMNGSTVYVRLWSLTANGWLYNDYTYTAAGGTVV